MPARGILAYGAYVPYRRLARLSIAEVTGVDVGTGHRAVASFDEDTTTMGVEAARIAIAGQTPRPSALWFSTPAPAYLDKTNATILHSALRLPAGVSALDFGGAPRSAMGALRTSFGGDGPTLVVASDIRIGLAGGLDEAVGGDGASAILVGSESNGPLLARYLGGASATAEFTDRWRTPGETYSQVWEERFGEAAYSPMVEVAWADALASANLTASQVSRAVVTGLHARAVSRSATALGIEVVDDLVGEVGNTGAAHPGLLLAHVLDESKANEVLALIALADGCEVLLFRTTEALVERRSAPAVATQIADGSDLPYGRYLAWRGLLDTQLPNRPAPARVSSAAAYRNNDWKLGLVGSREVSTGIIHMAPPRVAGAGGFAENTEPVPMSEASGTVVAVTVDKLAYSPNPPVVFAVVDFEGGGRMPVEVTDVDSNDVTVGDQVEMTFRRMGTTDGIHNYFWKARPQRA